MIIANQPIADLLDIWVEQKTIRLLDKHIAQQMMMFESNADELYQLICVLCSHNLAQQHSCLRLDTVDFNNPLNEYQPHCQLSGSTESLIKHLTRYNTIGSPNDETPFVLEQARLYLRRYYHYEQALAQQIQTKAKSTIDYAFQDIEPLTHTLFPATSKKQIDWQKVAALTALGQKFTTITGGPGTGKTTTVAKLLMLVRQLQPEFIIKLVAPTGKAAARLSESIKHSKTKLASEHPTLQALIESLPEETTTVHRLLGVVPNSHKFRHHRDKTLNLDMLIVDEASMIDLPLMYRLFDALPEHAQIILLGDPEQLSSVEAGCVLADICSGLQTKDPTQPWKMQYSIKTAKRLTKHTQEPLQEFAIDQPTLGDTLCVLTTSYRFAEDSGIGKLAKAVNQGDLATLKKLQQAKLTDLTWFTQQNQWQTFIDHACKHYQTYLDLMNQLTISAQTILEAYNDFRVLAATRSGEMSVEHLNRDIERHLTTQGLLQTQQEFYLGRPVLIERNDYALNLFNGDIGLILQLKDDERPMAYFQTSHGHMERFLPARLPPHKTCFAMTIHKSQGSEFNTVATVLPAGHTHQLLTRELLYTAITRAKKNFISFATPESLTHATSTPTVRSSGLKNKLWSQKASKLYYVDS